VHSELTADLVQNHVTAGGSDGDIAGHRRGCEVATGGVQRHRADHADAGQVGRRRLGCAAGSRGRLDGEIQAPARSEGETTRAADVELAVFEGDLYVVQAVAGPATVAALDQDGHRVGRLARNGDAAGYPRVDADVDRIRAGEIPLFHGGALQFAGMEVVRSGD